MTTAVNAALPVLAQDFCCGTAIRRSDGQGRHLSACFCADFHSGSVDEKTATGAKSKVWPIAKRVKEAV